MAKPAGEGACWDLAGHAIRLWHSDKLDESTSALACHSMGLWRSDRVALARAWARALWRRQSPSAMQRSQHSSFSAANSCSDDSISG